MEPSTAQTKRSFWCFISYRHADNQQAGRQWATWLHQALETYEVPADLVGRPNLEGEAIPERIYPVFRDEEELPADADLSRPIISALQNSRCLLVICSPRACESRFVADEIVRFKAMGKSHRVIAAIIAGEPNASTDPAKIRQNLVECFPEPLRFEVEEDLSISNRQAEPVAADFRIEETGEEGWVSPQAYRTHLQAQGLTSGAIAQRLKTHAQRMELMRLKIIAGVLQVDLGELTRRDQRYQLEQARKRARVLRRWLVAVGVLTVLAVASSFIAIRKQRQVVALNLAQEKNLQAASWSSFHQADRLLADADASQDGALISRKSQEALLHLARAIQFNEKNPIARERFAWELSLRRASLVQPDANLPLKSAAGWAVFSPDGGKFLTSEADDTVSIWDARTRQRLATCQPGKQLFQSSDRDVLDELSPYAIFSPDSTTFLTSCFEKRIELWDGTSGKRLRSLTHPSFVKSASYSADGKWILTTCDDGQARVWDAKSAKLIHSLACDSVLPTTVFSADGSRILNALGSRVSILDSATGAALREIPHGTAITELACSSRSPSLAVLDEANQVQVWRFSEEGPPTALRFSSPVRRIFLSPDASRLVAVFKGTQAVLVEVASGKELARITHDKPINHCTFSNDGSTFATSSWDATARIWKSVDGRPVATLLHPGAVNSIAFDPAGTSVITACADLSAKLWTLPETSPCLTLRHDKPVSQISFSPDGRSLVSASTDSTARIWNLPDGTLQYTLQAGNPLNMAVVSRDARFIATSDSAQGASLWEASSGKLLRSIPLGEFASDLALHPTGSPLVTAHRDNSARVWDVATGRMLFHLRHSLLDADTNLNQAAYSTKGDFIVTAGNDHQAILWNAATGSQLRKLPHEKAVYHAEFSPDDGSVLTCSADKTAVLWQRESGRKLHVFQHSEEVIAAHFDPSGRHVASASADGEVKRWDASSGALLATLPHPAAVTQCVFSADGASLLTTCNDRIARLWDLSSSSILATFPGAGKFNSIAISPDQSTLAIAGEDGSIRLYDWKQPRLFSRSTTPADCYETIAQAVTGSEITASGNLHRLTFEELTNAKARADSLSPTAQPEAELWKSTRPSGAGR